MTTRIDLRRTEEARAWAESANIKRPWRMDFFAAIVSELCSLRNQPVSVLELGSGPGFLAECVIRALPNTSYTLFDYSPAMHEMARCRVASAQNVSFVVGDFHHQNWSRDLVAVDAVVTMQAVHELSDKGHAVALHEATRDILRPGGLYLVCDHIAGPGGMSNREIFMTASEQAEALAAAAFPHVSVVLERNGLVLHRALKAA